MAEQQHADLRALAEEVAVLLASSAQTNGGLLTARDVAMRFNVDRGWVYAHADELGVIRLGMGTRPRLRFDPAVVGQRLVATPLSGPRHSPGRIAAGSPLLPITPSRPRRLGS